MRAYTLEIPARILISGVWIFHGLYSKILDGIPRHKLIVGKILVEEFATPATILIGTLEILLGCWVLLGKFRKYCAALMTMALVAMNTLEIILARELLISAVGMVALNLGFIAIIWWWAKGGIQPSDPS